MREFLLGALLGVVAGLLLYVIDLDSRLIRIETLLKPSISPEELEEIWRRHGVE